MNDQEPSRASNQREDEVARGRAYQEHADTLCQGCRHPRHVHTDGGVEHRLRTGMPCTAEEPDVADEERWVSCMCLGWWEPGEPFPHQPGKGTTERMAEEVPGDADRLELIHRHFGVSGPATESETGTLVCTCGSERWITDVVVEDGAFTEHGALRCARCGRSPDGGYRISRSDVYRYGLDGEDR